MPQNKVMRRKPKERRKGAYPVERAGRGRRGRGGKKEEGEGKAGTAAVTTRRGRGGIGRKGGKKEKKGWQQGFYKKTLLALGTYAQCAGAPRSKEGTLTPGMVPQRGKRGNIRTRGEKKMGEE